MTMKEFARILNGREYDCCMFTKQEIQQAKDEGGGSLLPALPTI